jgi:hypothetical protein
LDQHFSLLGKYQWGPRRARPQISGSGPEQDDAVLTSATPDSDDLPVVVDAQSLNHFPSSPGIQKVVQVVQLIVAVKETVKVFVALGEGASDDFAVVVKVTSDAESAAQGSQHTARAIFLFEGLDSTGRGIERHACALAAIIESEDIVAIVIERSEVDYLEPLRATGSTLTIWSRFGKPNCFHRT